MVMTDDQLFVSAPVTPTCLTIDNVVVLMVARIYDPLLHEKPF